MRQNLAIQLIIQYMMTIIFYWKMFFKDITFLIIHLAHIMNLQMVLYKIAQMMLLIKQVLTLIISLSNLSQVKDKFYKPFK